MLSSRDQELEVVSHSAGTATETQSCIALNSYNIKTAGQKEQRQQS